MPETVSTDPLPTVQIDGVVWSQVIAGNTVYAGGNFTTARPAGSPAGVNTVPRSNLLAYNLTTGELITGFAPTLNGEVKSLAVSPDGTRVYAAGSFTQVNGLTRNRVVAFDVASGAVVAGFAPPPTPSSTPSGPRTPPSTSAATSPPSAAPRAPAWPRSTRARAPCCPSPRPRRAATSSASRSPPTPARSSSAAPSRPSTAPATPATASERSTPAPARP
ncbi:hypothetical protein [Naasia aerilata]|uniref:hypothetical protein n=1 Tax=Naasia aerilata TaxID=1162966 RepID=UPI0025737E8F|nr:hypothetical protein [Naasia aerilata]